MTSFVLLIAALVAFLIAAFAPFATPGDRFIVRVGWGWLGLALADITWLIAAYPG